MPLQKQQENTVQPAEQTMTDNKTEQSYPIILERMREMKKKLAPNNLHWLLLLAGVQHQHKDDDQLIVEFTLADMVKIIPFYEEQKKKLNPGATQSNYSLMSELVRAQMQVLKEASSKPKDAWRRPSAPPRISSMSSFALSPADNNGNNRNNGKEKMCRPF